MKNHNTNWNSRLMLVFAFFACLLGNQMQAQSYSRTVSIAFDAAPGTVTVNPAKLKYDKDFAYSLTLDDATSDHWAIAFPLLNGGSVPDDYITTYGNPQQNYGTGIGIDYTSDGYKIDDGCENPIPFTLGLAITKKYVQDDDSDIIFGNLEWSQLKEMYEAGWDVLNHSYTHQSPTDFDHEIETAAKEIQDKLGFYPRHFVIPSNLEPYITEFMVNTHGMKAVYNQGDYPNGPQIAVDAPLTGTAFYKVNRGTLLPSNTDTAWTDLKLSIDNAALYKENNETVPVWKNDYSHSIRGSQVPNLSNLGYVHFKHLMDYLQAGLYGPNNVEQEVWVAGVQEVYEYLYVRDKTQISTQLDGNTLTTQVTYNDPQLDQRYFDLSLLVDWDNTTANITSIKIDGVDYPFLNCEKGLINLELVPACTFCTDYIISNNTTWTSVSAPIGPIGQITVESGATLTIDSGVTLAFCTTGKLSINSGGRVNMYGSLTSCDTEWGGVRLGPGARFTGDGGTISNARRAIQGTMFTQGPIGFNVPAPRIICNNMDFLNNEIGLYILDAGWYANPTSGPNTAFTPSNTFIVRMTNCEFDVDANLNFQSHVVLRNTGKTTFSGCDFAYSQTNARNFSSRGIFASNSRFTVKANGMSDPSSFSDLAKGIEVIQAYRPSAYVVEDSQFDRCAVGIHNMGTTGGKILRNQFNMGDMDINYYAEDTRQIGVSFEGATNGIVLEENMFKNMEQTGKTVSSTYGTTARDLWPNDANVIRNNTFTDMAYANWAEGFSGDLDVGLHYLCNDHTNPIVRGWNFIAMDPTEMTHNAMRIHQGLTEFGGLQYAPARNTFSQIMGNGSGGADNLRDFWASTDDVYQYYYWDNPSAPLEKPEHHNVVAVPRPTINGNTCASNYKPGEPPTKDPDKQERRTVYYTHRTNYELAKAELDQIVHTGTPQEIEQAESQVAYHRQQMDAAAFAGYMAEVADTTAVRDSIRTWMRRFDNPTGDYMLAMDFMATSEYPTSLSTLDFMRQKYAFSEKEWMDYRDMYYIIESLIAADGVRLPSNVLSELTALADTEEGQAAYLARQILSSDYGYFYRPIITSVPEQLNKPDAETGGDGEDAGPKMIVSPNPTDYYVRFDWSAFATSGRKVLIEVTDQTGGLLAILKPTAGTIGMDWTTEKVTGSICYYRLLIDGVEHDGGQIIVNK